MRQVHPVRQPVQPPTVQPPIIAARYDHPFAIGLGKVCIARLCRISD
jgi:hypothetical protein